MSVGPRQHLPHRDEQDGRDDGRMITRKARLIGHRKIRMNWTTPTLVEICIGLEINGYLPAEF
jgi:coenzyme PQQ precursor peptide PqqA